MFYLDYDEQLDILYVKFPSYWMDANYEIRSKNKYENKDGYKGVILYRALEMNNMTGFAIYSFKSRLETSSVPDFIDELEKEINEAIEENKSEYEEDDVDYGHQFVGLLFQLYNTELKKLLYHTDRVDG